MAQLKYKDYKFETGEFGHPNKPGVYAVFTYDYETQKDTLLYIGSSKNMSKRINSTNHIYRKTFDLYSHKLIVYTMSCEIENYRQVEIEMIKEFNPIFNVQHKVK